MAISSRQQDWVLALEFKRSVCETFCRKDKICENCPAYTIDSRTYKELKIGDIIGLPGRRRRR